MIKRIRSKKIEVPVDNFEEMLAAVKQQRDRATDEVIKASNDLKESIRRSDISIKIQKR